MLALYSNSSVSPLPCDFLDISKFIYADKQGVGDTNWCWRLSERFTLAGEYYGRARSAADVGMLQSSGVKNLIFCH
tara:strand:- start:617 stop:844 length:228 start_codon:yes stop_codon:yes gene_type:complete